MITENIPSDGNLSPANFKWTNSSELALFQALIIHKPAGINKHFSMALVAEKLATQLGPDITSEAIWSKLRTMFDLAAVDDREEVIPFPLEEKEFSFPRRDYGSLVADKQKEIINDRALGRGTKGGVSRVSADMGSEQSRRNVVLRDKSETPKTSKVSDQKSEDQNKSFTKRHTTRSTPLSTPTSAKKKK
eukprot:TRINITY_DN43116_c0_g1_i1.p1 TRINITY_DN43116_c0_g1~~TRINITY_DN43116_c0_g1_i1.p1  ORF type:complete len:190 (-),score=60.48 TRINITY_DN43116_c0_g1_i1:81-650(-)